MRLWSIGLILPLTAGNLVYPEDDPAGPPIHSVAFEGRQWIPTQRLLQVLGLRPGDPWTAAAEKEATESLMSWPFLQSVSVPRVTTRPDGTVDIVYSIEESRVIGGIFFDGNDAFDDNDLLAASRLQVGDAYNQEKGLAAKAAILARYYEDGFLLASVRVNAEPAGQGRLELMIQIEERRRVSVEEVRIEGAGEISPPECLRAIGLQPRRLFGVISRGYYVPHKLEEDLDRLRKLYLSRGFLSVQVGLEALTFNANYSKVAVTLRVREGSRSIVEAVRITGHQSFPTALLERELKVETGKHFSSEEVDAGRRRLLSWYQEHSDILPRISVPMPEYAEDNKVTVVYVIEEKEKVFTGEVKITGNRLTRDRVIRQGITLMPGEHFKLLELERSAARLKARGLFSEIQVKGMERNEELSDEEREFLDVEFAVKEKETKRMLELGGGASSGSGEIFYARLGQDNFDLFRLPRDWSDWSDAFIGGGQVLEAELIPGNEESMYRFRFLEPYFFRSDLSLALGASTSLFKRKTYDEDRFRGNIAVRKYLDDDRRLSASLGFVGDQVRIHDLDDAAPSEVVDEEGYSFFAYPRLELRYENLNPNYYSGPAGFKATGELDFADSAFGSEADFLRLKGRADLFFPFFDSQADYRHTLHLGLEVATVESLEGRDAPFYERYYLGGPRTFRGFGYRRLGPHEGRTPLGGGGMIWGTVEYSFPLVWREIRGIALFDWGDLTTDFSSLSTGRLRTAAGGGVQVRLRLLDQRVPANFYWVQALSSEGQDREQVFSFSLGLPF